MIPVLTYWQRVALALRLLTGTAYAVRLPDDRWPQGLRIRRIEVLRMRG